MPRKGAKSPVLIIREILGADRVRMALRAMAEEFRAEWSEGLSQPGHGRFYEAGLRFITTGGRVVPLKDRSGVKRSGGHRASAADEAPAKDTGALANAIGVDDRDPDNLRVGAAGKYGRRLLMFEFGLNVQGSKVGPNPGGILIAPRPSARAALERARPRMIEAARAVLR